MFAWRCLATCLCLMSRAATESVDDNVAELHLDEITLGEDDHGIVFVSEHIVEDHSIRTGVWCDDLRIFDFNEGRVVCQLAGYSTVTSVGSVRVDGDHDVIVRHTKCPSDAFFLSDCEHYVPPNVTEAPPIREHTCEYAAYVSCEPHPMFLITEFRLSDGNEGFIEARSVETGEWGYWCDDLQNFGYIGAGDMICRAVGYSSQVSHRPVVDYARAENVVISPDIECPPDPNSMSECGFMWRVEQELVLICYSEVAWLKCE